MIQVAFSKSHISYLRYSSQNLFAVKLRILLAFSGQFPNIFGLYYSLKTHPEFRFVVYIYLWHGQSSHPRFAVSFDQLNAQVM